MKKNAFTLAEIVVTLGIIGIVTAMTAPSLMNLMPDKSKVEVLKVYKLINDATIEPNIITINNITIILDTIFFQFFLIFVIFIFNPF